MPEQYESPRSVYQNEKKAKKAVVKLGKKITDVVPHKLPGMLTSDDPEYWGLREVLTDEMVDIANKMKLRKFYTYEELLLMNPRVEPAHLHEVLEQMAWIGILEYDYGDHYDHYGEIDKDKPRVKRYRVPYFVPGSAELFNSSKDRVDKNPAVASFFERMTFLPLAGITQMVPPGGDGIGMHVIPVEKAIAFENESVDLEHISYWLKKYEGHISAGICSCRYSRSKLGEGCGDDPDDWCIQVGDMADYTVETGRAHYITKEEALEILQKAEDNGFVHQITNIDGSEHIFDICNCDVKICNALRTSMLFNTPNLSKSAYTAKVTPENCVACGCCVESCPSGAVKLGQKLCAKDGSHVQYPKSVLPDKILWGKYAWDENYRDTMRMYNSYFTGSSPCKAACPAHVPVQGYLKKAHDGKYQEALALIKKENPFPAVCGRICNKRCEEACTRGDVDRAVSIDAVKKFVADFDLHAETRYIPKKVVPSMHGHFDQKIAIIGGGPAGLSCAYYLALMGYTPTVFEKHEKAGGMMMYGIPSYKLEKDVIDAEIDVIQELGVEIKTGVEVGRDVTIPELKEQGYKAFYIAIGCQGGRRPGVPHDDAEGTFVAVEYLNDSLMHDHPAYDGNVVVVGGGNVAIDCAQDAKRRGAASVTMVSLETADTMPASNDEIAEAMENGISIVNAWGPKEVKVDENGAVAGLIFKKCIRTIDPETNKFSPLYDEAETMELPCTRIVFAIGQAIEWGDLLRDSKVTFWHGNYPVADPLTFQTKDPDIFVGGDVYSGPKFVIDAIAAGHYAAESLHRHVQPNADMIIGRDRHNYLPLDKDNITFPPYDAVGRQEPKDVPVKDPFKDFHGTLTPEQVMIETGRCLRCGASVVDENKCIGCGICTTRCKFDAIHLYRDHPENTDMRKAEDKVRGLAAYAIRRGIKIIQNSQSDEALRMRMKRIRYNETHKEFNKKYPHTGNSLTGEPDDPNA
ncbi:MAG: FAD-dependent oxidoreductase [Lachnospiraceae bacterium]|nr:FAD-dependent oxidoreductase [Lachnospiraceae bacterium]